jgi:monomeric sarcosine oxidase
MEIDRRSFVRAALAAGAVGTMQAAENGSQAAEVAERAEVTIAYDSLATPPPSGTRFDIIIIGGGTIGLSAAYYAAKRDLKTLLLEQYDQFANSCASSGGYSRFFRIMHSSAYMAELAETALALWQEIETASNSKIFKPHRLIFYGVSGTTPEGNLGEMERILANLGVQYDWYGSRDALRNAFPVFKYVPDDYIGLVQPNSAVIRTRESMAAFHKLATSEGATLLTKQRAAVTTRKGVYQVTCPAGTYSSPHLILAPSAWTNHLLRPFNTQLNLQIWQMTVAYFQAEVNKFEYPFWYEFGPEQSEGKAPMLRMTKTGADQDLFYGFPPDEKPGYIKASADFAFPPNKYTDPDQCTCRPDPEILSRLGRFLQERFNGVSPMPIDHHTCLYTMSRDYQMVLDKLPGHPNVAIFTLDSGRGFKFTPLFGRVLVDLATTGSTGYDISPFSINRPGIIK